MLSPSPAHVLIICPEPEAYTSRLAPAFPQVKFSTFASLECTPAMDLMGDADAIIAYGRAFDAQCLARAKKLRWFQCLITGTDHLAPVLAGSRVILTNARGIHGPQMAEMAILHMLALSRQVPQLVRNQAAHVWDRILPRVLDRRVIAIFGVGAIAEHVAKVCQAFGMTTLGISRTPRKLPGFDAIYPREQLREAAAQADFLLVLVPYTSENHKVIDAAVFEAMKPSAYLINIARGGVVDEAALVKALRDRKIAGAGLDVFEEAPLPPTHPLWDMDNVFITPFIGGRSDRYEESIMSIIKPNLERFLAGRDDEMINRVTL
ncbi:MAG TPA: D-2-hydroxyacid dehydrogenase [Xanthobacteraceae bacterium]